jgi:hypothetical protein
VSCGPTKRTFVVAMSVRDDACPVVDLQWDVELLLLALQHCGFHLRSEDPDRLKGLLSTIEAKSVSGKATGSVRLEVMLELIQDVRNKRVKQAHQQIMDRGAALRKWINRLASRHDQSGIDR